MKERREASEHAPERETNQLVTAPLYNINPAGFILGVAGALFGVLFACYALLRKHQPDTTKGPARAVPTASAQEIPVDLDE